MKNRDKKETIFSVQPLSQPIQHLSHIPKSSSDRFNNTANNPLRRPHHPSHQNTSISPLKQFLNAKLPRKCCSENLLQAIRDKIKAENK